jgi:hypothetical protein
MLSPGISRRSLEFIAAKSGKGELMHDPDLEKQYDEHAALVGRVTLAWSNIHSEVFAIFSLLCGMKGRRSEVIFFALKSDASQREITLAIINEIVSEPLRNKAKTLFGRISGFAGERNLATHTMWATITPAGNITPNPMIRQPSLLRQDYEQQFQTLIDRLRDLFRELLRFHQEIVDEMNRSDD